MPAKRYLFGPNQKRVLYLAAALLWLIGILTFKYLGGLSIVSLVGFSVALLACVSSTVEIKWWINISVFVMGIFWITASYSEYIDPIGNASIREWWILGVIDVIVGIYWLIQRALAIFIHN